MNRKNRNPVFFGKKKIFCRNQRIYLVFNHISKVQTEVSRENATNLSESSTPFAEHELVESEDHVEINGVIFNKPFVEKPVSAEDHNIYIYYPTSAGGGSQRLFRKIGSRSSVYSPESRVRKTGSFIYEDFMPTDGKRHYIVFFFLFFVAAPMI